MFLSYSQVWAFWSCPRLSHYLAQPLLRLQRPWSQAAGRTGSAVHQVLHLAATAVHAETLPQVQDLQQQSPQVWENYTSALREIPGQPERVLSEWECCVPLPADWQLPYVLTGRLDRLVIEKDRAWVLDWKTGQARDPDAIHLQLRFYAWLVYLAREALCPAMTEVRATAHYLDTGHREERVLTLEQAEAEGDFFRQLLTAYHEQQQAEVQGIPNPRSTSEGPWCTMCEYQRLCPEGKYHAQ